MVFALLILLTGLVDRILNFNTNVEVCMCDKIFAVVLKLKLKKCSNLPVPALNSDLRT